MSFRDRKVLSRKGYGRAQGIRQTVPEMQLSGRHLIAVHSYVVPSIQSVSHPLKNALSVAGLMASPDTWVLKSILFDEQASVWMKRRNSTVFYRSTSLDQVSAFCLVQCIQYTCVRRFTMLWQHRTKLAPTQSLPLSEHEASQSDGPLHYKVTDTCTNAIMHCCVIHTAWQRHPSLQHCLLSV